MSDQRPAPGNRPLQAFAVLTAAATLFLILAGGFVTSTGTGDTISEWPLLWGHIAPGFQIEWTHRVSAMAVGVLSTILLVWTHAAGASRPARTLALIAFLGVLVQALIGGVRIYVPEDVYPKYRAIVAIIHACFAQVVFSGMIALALVLSPSWTGAKADEPAAAARRLGLMTVLFAFLQLVAGAVTRHTGAALYVHIAGALLVFVHVALFASRLVATSLRRGGYVLIALLLAQMGLGIASWVLRGTFARSVDAPLLPVAIVTSHVAVGALILAFSVRYTLRCFRAARPVEAPALEAVRP